MDHNGAAAGVVVRPSERKWGWCHWLEYGLLVKLEARERYLENGPADPEIGGRVDPSPDWAARPTTRESSRP
jgi:hypothetical protein